MPVRCLAVLVAIGDVAHFAALEPVGSDPGLAHLLQRYDKYSLLTVALGAVCCHTSFARLLRFAGNVVPDLMLLIEFDPSHLGPCAS